MTKPSISFRVPEQLWTHFKKQTQDLFLARAPFLDHVLEREIPHLRADLKGLKQSHRAKREISKDLKKKGLVSVNIEARQITIDALKKVLDEHNVLRDAFMTRLIVFLRSTDYFLEHLGVPKIASNKAGRASLEEMPTSPLKAMEAVRDDPLFYIRSHLEEAGFGGIYRVNLGEDFLFAACYIEDELVPGTSVGNMAARENAKIWALLNDEPLPRRTYKRRGAK
jgi:hypothetical protein